MWQGASYLKGWGDYDKKLIFFNVRFNFVIKFVSLLFKNVPEKIVKCCISPEKLLIQFVAFSFSVKQLKNSIRTKMAKQFFAIKAPF